MTIKILYIEDNDQNFYLVNYILSAQGYSVSRAHDGREGIDLAEKNQPDLILLDIQLPVMDGYETARELRKIPALQSTPIVALTSYAMAGDREKALAAGCTGYIEKPINPHTFVAEVRQYLPGRHTAGGYRMTRVLIVDDIAANLYLLDSILKGHGFSVTSAKDGAGALAAAKQDPPDLIITDILMPIMDGFELCRQWKADERLATIPFIFYTATYTEAKDENLARSLGADRFIVKPRKPDELIREIRAVLDETRDRPKTAPPPAGPDEKTFLREYNEVLFGKLEKKVRQLEAEIAIRREMQRQREDLIRELEQKNAELAQFTRTVSHELRAPLVTIRGFAGLIEEETAKGGECSDLTGHVRRISSAVDILDSRLSDLQKIARAGMKIEDRRPVGFGTVASEVFEIFAPVLSENGIRIEIEPDLPVVHVNRDRIREVLINLIGNAVMYRRPQSDTVVRIGVRKAGTPPVFFVQDNGMGIEPRYLERIFNIFEKLDAGMESNGIGLTVARRIIEAHGGKIWAESEGAETGTTFCFTLPGGEDGSPQL